MQKKKILIVGSNGYIGSRLVQLFNKKYIIKGIDRNFFKNCTIGKIKKISITDKCASSLNRDDLKEIDALIFLAAFNNDPLGNVNPKIIYDKELNYTLKAARLCKKLNIKFIYPSSCSVYGFGKNKFNESSKLNPLTLYSKNKVNIENKLKRISNKSFKPIILRLATVFGPSPRLRLDLVANMFCGMSIVNNKIELNSNGLSWRPHVYIDDVCEVIAYFIDQNKALYRDNIYNVGNDKNNLLTIQLANKLIKSNKKLKIEKLKLKNQIFSDKKIVNGVDKRSYMVSFLKLKKLMRTKYPSTNIILGLKKLNEFLKKNNFNKKMLYSKKYYRLQWYDYISKVKGVKIV